MKLIGDDRLLDLMKLAGEVPLARISEREFVERYLPLFANVNNVPDLDMTPWLAVTNPCNRVIVHDNNDESNILYYVPPLLTTDNEPFVDNPDAPSVSNLVATAQQMEVDRPGYGNHYMSSRLAAHIQKTKLQLSIAMQWNAIFKRYNLPLIPIGDVKHITTEPIKPAGVDDVYEDL